MLTLFLSYTGYLLPWDQLAFWAITVGSNLISAVPVFGTKIRFLVLGGHTVNANALLRFYVPALRNSAAKLPLSSWRSISGGFAKTAESIRERARSHERAQGLRRGDGFEQPQNPGARRIRHEAYLAARESA